MDSLLITTGLTSLVLGAAMTWFAWSIVRQNRRREAARVALLSGLAFPDGAPVVSPAAPGESHRAAAVRGASETENDTGSLFPQYFGARKKTPGVVFHADELRPGLPAADVDLIASRAFASDEFPSESATPIEQSTPIEWTSAIERATTTETLFREPEKSGAASRRTIALAGVCVVLAIAVGTYKVVSTTVAPPAAGAATAPAPAPPATVPEARVELLALDHASTPAGLVVTGRLRNPADAASLHDVVAVVDVLDQTGRVLTTARASIGRANLNAGESSDFTVATAKTADVARYRVVFHARERQSIPQIDRRPATPTSQSE